MEIRTPGFHIEHPMTPSSENLFSEIYNVSSLATWKVDNQRELAYEDTFWDTRRGDLHSSSRTLRTRKRKTEIEFIDFKGPPQYLFQTLFSRPLYSESTKSSEEALTALKMQRPSAPIQALFKDRVDLIGNELVEVASCLVKRKNIDLFTEQGVGFCTLSLHQYKFKIGKQETNDEFLIEVQPYCSSPVVTEKLPKIFSKITNFLSDQGWNLSPVSKYHRIPRGMLEESLRDLQ